MGVGNCSRFCCTLLYVHFSIAIILMGKRELDSLLNLMVTWIFLTVPWGCLRFVIVVFPDHTHLLYLKSSMNPEKNHVKWQFYTSKQDLSPLPIHHSNYFR